jgi:hypothetical protein
LVGEGVTDDPTALAYFRRSPGTYVIVERSEPFVGLDPILRPEDMAVIEAAARGERHSEGFELLEPADQDPALFSQLSDEAPVLTTPLSATVNIVAIWPESLDPAIVTILDEAGWTPEDVKAASDAQLEALRGIGPAAVKKIRAAFA